MNQLNIFFNTAIEYHRLGELSKAEGIYKKIIKQDKSNADAWHLLGVLFYQKNNLNLCITHIEKAIQLNPNISSFHSNIGLAYHEKNQFNKAIESFYKALKLNPNYPEALNNLGNSLRKIAKKGSLELQEALECYQRALQLVPNYPEAFNNLGNLFLENNNYEDAMKCYEAAERYNPQYSDAFYNIGYLSKKMRQFDKAIESFEKVLSLPAVANKYTLNSLFESKREICDWNGIEKLERNLISKTLDKSDTTLIDPFTVISKLTDCSQETQYKLIKKYSDSVISDPTKKIFTHKMRKYKKIKLGYVSADLYDHPVLQNIQGLFSTHDRDKFEVYLFGLYHDKESKYFQKILPDVDSFIDISNFNDEEAAKKIYQIGIDILIDLQGYTTGARPQIFSQKSAPLQVQFHAYAGTMACNFIDYIITDEIITPKEVQNSFSEKFVYMPDTYFITYDKQQISKNIPSKKDCGLPEDSFVFCCFNNTYKIEAKIFSVWMDILKEVPQSVLWLYSSNKFAIENLKNEAKKAGVNPVRIIFAEKLSKEEHLARIKNGDLFLDTFYYNAHTTAIDALHANLPLITCKGERFASRVASSILLAHGLDELVCEDFDSYKKLAIEFARDKDKLLKIKQKLMINKRKYPLFNTTLFVKNLETGFTMMWDNYLNHKKPKILKIHAGELS